jgi:WD40 repeat protein
MPSTIYCVAFTPDGKQVVTGSYDRSLKLWDVVSGNMVREFKPFTEKMFEKGHRDQVFCVAFTSDGQFMASGSSDKSIKLWKVADGAVVREFSNPAWKAPAPNEAAPAHPGWIYGLRFSPDDKHLISVGAAPKNRGYMAAWNVADGKMLFGSELPTGPIYSMSLNKEGTSILIGCGPMNRQDGTSEAYLLKTPK